MGARALLDIVHSARGPKAQGLNALYPTEPKSHALTSLDPTRLVKKSWIGSNLYLIPLITGQFIPE